MIDPGTRITARIKLAELRRQRDRLVAHYARLEQGAAAAADPREQLRALYRGLREATFAQKPLHPDVANLEALLFEADLGTASAEMLGQWLDRLRREVAETALAAYDGPARQRKPPALPEEDAPWLSFGQRWFNYFQQWLQPVRAKTPVATPGLEALLDDFVARSGEVAGRTADERRPARRGRKAKSKRTNLSVYWQWVVYTYGPQLLGTLGTFRFLVTELVPLQLIVRNRIDASSLTEDADPGLAEGGAELLPA